jgi:hypothetical protein
MSEDIENKKDEEEDEPQGVDSILDPEFSVIDVLDYSMSILDAVNELSAPRDYPDFDADKSKIIINAFGNITRCQTIFKMQLERRMKDIKQEHKDAKAGD